jgi:hypothetical protein
MMVHPALPSRLQVFVEPLCVGFWPPRGVEVTHVPPDPVQPGLVWSRTTLLGVCLLVPVDAPFRLCPLRASASLTIANSNSPTPHPAANSLLMTVVAGRRDVETGARIETSLCIERRWRRALRSEVNYLWSRQTPPGFPVTALGLHRRATVAGVFLPRGVEVTHVPPDPVQPGLVWSRTTLLGVCLLVPVVPPLRLSCLMWAWGVCLRVCASDAEARRRTAAAVAATLVRFAILRRLVMATLSLVLCTHRALKRLARRTRALLVGRTSNAACHLFPLPLRMVPLGPGGDTCFTPAVPNGVPPGLRGGGLPPTSLTPAPSLPFLGGSRATQLSCCLAQVRS